MVINVARTAVNSVLETPVIMSTVAVPMAVRRVIKVLHVPRVSRCLQSQLDFGRIKEALDSTLSSILDLLKYICNNLN